MSYEHEHWLSRSIATLFTRGKQHKSILVAMVIRSKDKSIYSLCSRSFVLKDPTPQTILLPITEKKCRTSVCLIIECILFGQCIARTMDANSVMHKEDLEP
jgi:hypothetical protein